jgi:hypothetical protein
MLLQPMTVQEREALQEAANRLKEYLNSAPGIVDECINTPSPESPFGKEFSDESALTTGSIAAMYLNVALQHLALVNVFLSALRPWRASRAFGAIPIISHEERRTYVLPRYDMASTSKVGAQVRASLRRSEENHAPPPPRWPPLLSMSVVSDANQPHLNPETPISAAIRRSVRI